MRIRTAIDHRPAAAVAIALCLATGVSWGQRIRFPQPSATSTTFQGSTAADGLVPVPSGTTPRNGGSPASALGQPGFDPYSTSAAPNAASTAPTLSPQSPTVGSPALGPQTFGGNPAAPVYPAPSSAYSTVPQQPPVLFPNGISWPGGIAAGQPNQYMRVFQDLRLRYTWLSGKDAPDKMQTHDVEVGTTFNWPNFLWANKPLHVSPIFVFHFWDGPESDPVQFPTELPSKVYSALLNLRWEPRVTPAFGADIDVNAGVFSDFSRVTSNSVRFYGTGLFVLAVTPTVTLKGGVNYLDRLDLKLLPAAGILWTPNPQTHFDIYFPSPKLAQYLTTVGNTDIWWYVNGEYGGGSWTFDRSLLVGGAFVPNGGDARMDINDIRVGIGVEWTGYSGARGFTEVAYVWDRQLIFASGTSPQKLQDTIMLRGGVSF